MREILYRAWDSKFKKMHPSDDLAITLEGKLLGYEDRGENEGTFIKMDKERAKDFILTQSTGLPDKAGKMIFEGDIFRKEIISFGKTQIDTYVVEFFLGGFQGVNILKGKMMPNADIFIKPLEIIGNKFQDKELLNNK